MLISCASLKEIKQAYLQPDYYKTIQLSNEAINKDSTNTEAWLYLAKSSIALGQMKQGLEALDQINRLDPKFKKHRRELAILYQNLGEKAFKTKQYQNAVQFYLSAESRDPRNKELMKQVAEVAFKANWLNVAKTRYEKLIDSSKDPNVIIQKLNLIESKMQFAQNEYDKGMKEYDAGHFGEAFKHFESATKTQADNQETEYYYYLSRGRYLSKLGNGNACLEAAKLFSRASQLKPKQAEPYYFTGRAYEMQNQHKSLSKAITAYRQALNLEPNGQYASYCKKKIETLSERMKRLDSFWNRGK